MARGNVVIKGEILKGCYRGGVIGGELLRGSGKAGKQCLIKLNRWVS